LTIYTLIGKMTTTTEYDVIIIGTNLVQSILAAAFARQGKKVLYVDNAKWYGGEHATLSFKEFIEFLDEKDFQNVSNSEQQSTSTFVVDTNAQKVLTTISGDSLSNFIGLGYSNKTLPEGIRASDVNIDLTSRLVFCRGKSVDILAESGVSRYLEFQTMDGVFYIENDKAKQSFTPILVPQSKNQVFSSANLTMLEKRQLMRFLQFCMDFQQNGEAEWTNERLGALNPGRSLSRPQNKKSDSELTEKAFLKQHETLKRFLKDDIRMSDRLSSLVEFTIAHQRSTSSPISVVEGMVRVGLYLGGLGRFGSTPFLTPMYGLGEICQGFSRLCAVYGGTCALNVSPAALYAGGVSFKIAENREELDYPDRLPNYAHARSACIVSSAYLTRTDAFSPQHQDKVRYEISCVCLLDKSIFGDGYNRVFFVATLQGENDQRAVHGVQLDCRAKVVSDGKYLLHLTTQIETSSVLGNILPVKDELLHLAQGLVSAIPENHLIWHGSFARRLLEDSFEHTSDNIYISGTDATVNTKGSDGMEVGLDEAFVKAERIFKLVCPDEPFLPPSETEVRARQEENADYAIMPDLT
jgi:RAB protein geranylgeranyltransferase component A